MADIFTNYLTGSDSLPNNGSLALPYKTVAKALTVQVQGDTIKVMEDEPITVVWTIPNRTSFTSLNSIVGVNSSGVEDGTIRRKITSTGGLQNWMTSGNYYSWTFKNLEPTGFTGSSVLVSSASNSWNNAHFYNCKFKNCSQLTGTNIGNRIAFTKCVFEDIAVSGNTMLMGLSTAVGTFQTCTFRRCSGLGGTTNVFLYALNIRDCLFVDCSVLRYFISAAYDVIGNVIDRLTFTGTGNVDNSVCGINISIAYTPVISNNLFTNILFVNTPTTSVKSVLTLSTSSGQGFYVKDNKSWNTGTAELLRKFVNPTLVQVLGENMNSALSETPWKNDDGVIANPMASYEYKENYAWRRKQQLLTDVSGWSYPT